MPYQYKRKPLTPDEATKVANACQTPVEKLCVWMLLDTGLRVSELATLKSRQLDRQTHRLTIYGSKTRRRIVPLSRRVRPILKAHLSRSDRFGMSVRTIERVVKRVAGRARLRRPCSPNVLRHTFSVTAAQKGISLPALQRLLGHDYLWTNQIYLKLSPEDVIREFQAKW
jgi:integrase/recombinase XerD